MCLNPNITIYTADLNRQYLNLILPFFHEVHLDSSISLQINITIINLPHIFFIYNYIIFRESSWITMDGKLAQSEAISAYDTMSLFFRTGSWWWLLERFVHQAANSQSLRSHIMSKLREMNKHLPREKSSCLKIGQKMVIIIYCSGM